MAPGDVNGQHRRCGGWPRRWPAGAWLPAAVLVLVLAGCQRGEPPSTATAVATMAAPAAPVAPVAPDGDDAAALVLPDVMEWVVDPAAAVLAAAADQHAWVDLAPRSDEAWQAVVDAAAELQRSGDLLLRPALARGRADWLESAAALRDGAVTAAAAARRHDPRGLYLAGVQVRSGCQACHVQQGLAGAPVGRP